MRFSDQYIWNFLFSLLFICLLGYYYVLLDTYGYRSIESLTVFDLAIISLAAYRLIRLFVYDKIAAFFREQFFDAIMVDGEEIVMKPAGGVRRTIADLLSCPWCFGIWASATTIFFYLLTPYALFLIYALALASVASMLQITGNLIGWKAEELKKNVERL